MQICRRLPTNYQEYTNLPDFIIEKWKKGQISNAHFADMLRVDLLCRHGGIWLDATILVTDNKLPSFMENAWFFIYQNVPVEVTARGYADICQCWAISSIPNNPVLELMRDLLFDFWRQNKKAKQYNFFCTILSRILFEYPDVWRKIPKACSSAPHLMQFEFDEPYSALRMQQLKEQTHIHKLKYNYKQVKAGSLLEHLLFEY